MNESKFTTYLLYAIGDIILVVVGILIAVSIDDWNAQQKELENERITITNLKEEFEENLISLNSEINRIDAIIASCDFIMQHTGPSYQTGAIGNFDSLLSATLSIPVWNPSTYTLNDIKNSGKLSKLSNQELKKLLIDWDSFYLNLNEWGAFYVTRSDKFFDFLIQHGNTRNMNVGYGLMKSRSQLNGANEQLIRNVQFENHLTDKVIISKFVRQFYMEATNKMDVIIQECES